MGGAEAHRVGAERSAPSIPDRLRWHAALLPADLACMLRGASCKGMVLWGAAACLSLSCRLHTPMKTARLEI